MRETEAIPDKELSYPERHSAKEPIGESSGEYVRDPEAEKKAVVLVELIKAGDEDAFHALAGQYRFLVESMAIRFAPSLGLRYAGINENGMGMEELRQDGYVALYKAAMSYDPEAENKGKAVRFGLYAKICIRNAYVSEVRRYKRVLRRLEKEKESAGAKYGKMEWMRASAEAAGTDNDVSAVLKKISQSLSEYEKKVFVNYIEGKPPREIAAELGRTEKSVSNAIYRIKVKNKGLLEKKN